MVDLMEKLEAACKAIVMETGNKFIDLGNDDN